jgi:four helix bundle protein
MGNYRDLSVWKRAHRLALTVYRATTAFPASERYGLTTQIRKASVSVISNIVEGSARHGDREHVRFLRIAHGSLCEMQCQLLLSHDLGFLRTDPWKSLDDDCQELGKMLNGLIRSLEPKPADRLSRLKTDD